MTRDWGYEEIMDTVAKWDMEEINLSQLRENIWQAVCAIEAHAKRRGRQEVADTVSKFIAD
jgi:hypothetical protein